MPVLSKGEHVASPEPFHAIGAEPSAFHSENDTRVADLATVEEKIPVKREPDDDLHSFRQSSALFLHKRRRLVVEVVLPTWAEVKKKREVYESDLKKLKKMKLNPNVKKVKNMELLPDTVRSRLKHLNLDLYPISLDRASQEVMVTRRFMSSTYGGSMQEVQPKIAKKFIDVHGLQDFFYMNLDYQPEAPQVPGAHGLYFCMKAGNDIDGIQRVFTRIRVGWWQYMGMYTVKSTMSLSKEEWAIQPAKVRNTWAKQICLQDWGWSVMARVRFRKEKQREPTVEDEVGFYKNKRYKITTPEEVAEAYDKGEERLGVWITECVGYDEEFQLRLCEEFSTYVPPQKDAKTGKQDDKKPRAKYSQQSSKAKHLKSAGTEGLGPESEDSRSDEEYEQNLVYRHKGTRSRPIQI